MASPLVLVVKVGNVGVSWRMWGKMAGSARDRVVLLMFNRDNGIIWLNVHQGGDGQVWGYMIKSSMFG